MNAILSVALTVECSAVFVMTMAGQFTTIEPEPLLSFASSADSFEAVADAVFETPGQLAATVSPETVMVRRL